MLLRSVLAFLLVAASAALAATRDDPWVEVRAPHFVVISNSSNRQARHVAAGFERMRAVFHNKFPKARVDASSPIIVLAVKDRKSFQALEPQAYLAKGQLDLTGLFLRTPEKNYVLMRLDVEGEHPYATIYHEYTHFITSHDQQWMPPWLNEGLAEFYQTTEIKDKEVQLGRPSVENILILRQNKLLPLATLFSVDRNSPYYHEENKASMFYAESWALTHYLEFKDRREHTSRLEQYVSLVSNKVDPVTAAVTAFGDLKSLEKNLNDYIAQPTFPYVTSPGSAIVDESSFKLETLSSTQADAVRADFLAYCRRVKDSRALLERILRQDPNNTAACETLGYLAYHEGNMEAAAKYYEQAVQLDSRSALAHYYFARVSMQKPFSAENATRIEASLRTSIQLNPEFAPAFDLLAQFCATHNRNLEEASLLNLKAIELEPSTIAFRLNRANLLMQMKRPNDAITLLQATEKLANNPRQLSEILLAQVSIQQNENPSNHQEEPVPQPINLQPADEPLADDDPPSALPDDSRHGPKRTTSGTLKNVQCSSPAVMRLMVEGSAKPISLHARNYYKVEYSAMGFHPSANMNPCKDLEAMHATVVYFEGATSAAEGQIIAIELRK
jgi:tetratricopeptide (TPR) repeat protein